MSQSANNQDASRRRLLSGALWAVWGLLAMAGGLGLGAVLRLFAGGRGSGATAAPVAFGPAELPAPGQAVARGGVALARDAGGYFALRLVCPHLGCTPVWRPAEARFACPCHGSSFALDGALQNGPARQGLALLAVNQGDGGKLIVDPAIAARPGQRLRA